MTQFDKYTTNPFPGLRSYDTEEAYLFFGREKQVNELVTRLQSKHFLAVIGTSGCGKSSLVRAGLLPSLAKGTMGDYGTKWKFLTFRPGDNPLYNLATTLINAESANANLNNTDKIEKLVAELRRNENALVDYVRKSSELNSHSLLIIVDQFEELFRFKQYEKVENSGVESFLFVGQLLEAIKQREVPLFISITMRSDFLNECTEFPGLTEAINEGQYLIPRMTASERKSAVISPLGVAGAAISPKLIERLMGDVSDNPNELPVLQHALMRTWDYWLSNKIEDEPIDVTHYEAIGGIEEALARHLEEAYFELKDNRSKLLAEILFKTLTDATSDNRGTRRPTPLHEICRISEAKEEQVIQVIECFRQPGRSFLMPSSKVKLQADTIIDISHESLMRSWQRLRKWLEEERNAVQLYMRLSETAAAYQLGKAGLWGNPELQLALKWQKESKPNAAWASRYDNNFERAMLFLEHSSKQYDLDLMKKEDARRRQLARARNFAVFMGVASGVSLLFLIIAMNLRFKAEASEKLALIQKQTAEQESRRAEEQKKVALSQKKISEQQQQIAEEQQKIAEQQRRIAEEQRIEALYQKAQAIFQKKKAVEAQSQAIKSRDEAEQQRQMAVEQKQLAESLRQKAEYSEKNTQRLRLLAIGRTLAIQAGREIKNGKEELGALLTLQGYYFNKESGGSAFNPDIYNALAQIADDQVVLRGHSDGIRALAVSQNGKLLASGSDDGAVKIWNIANFNEVPTVLKGLKPARRNVRSIAFSPDNEKAVVGYLDGSIYVWNVAQKESAPVLLKGHRAGVNAMAFDNSGQKLATVSADSTVRIWNVKEPAAAPQIIEKMGGRGTAITFSPDDNFLAIASEDGGVRLYEAKAGGLKPKVYKEHKKSVRSVAFSADGRYLASGGSDGSVIVRDLSASNKPLVSFVGHTAGVNSVLFSQDGKTLATASSDKTIRLWSFEQADSESIVLSGHDSWVWGMAFSPDGTKLYSGSADKTIRTWTTRADVLAGRVCGKVKRNMNQEEWNKYIGEDIFYRKTCTNLPEGK